MLKLFFSDMKALARGFFESFFGVLFLISFAMGFSLPLWLVVFIAESDKNNGAKECLIFSVASLLFVVIPSYVLHLKRRSKK